MKAEIKANAEKFAFEIFEEIAGVRSSDGRAVPTMAIFGICTRQDCDDHIVMTVADKQIWDGGDDDPAPADVGTVIDRIQAETRQTAGYFIDCLGYVIVKVKAYGNGTRVGTTLEAEDMHWM